MQTTHDPWRAPRPMAALAPPPAPMMARAFASAGASVAVRKQAIESQLGDYKLYTLPEPTTVAARQTKQVLFLDQPAVAFDKIYAYTIEPPDDHALISAPADRAPKPAQVALRLLNTASRGLGRPLPAGSVQLRQAQAGAGGRELLVGEPALSRDTPVGAPFELQLGRAADVTIADRMTSSQPGPGGRMRRAFEVVVTNGAVGPAVVELRHDRAGAAGFAVTAESARHDQKAGDPLWRFNVPPGGRETLTYSVEYARRWAFGVGRCGAVEGGHLVCQKDADEDVRAPRRDLPVG
jgi:hypothetical protein